MSEGSGIDASALRVQRSSETVRERTVDSLRTAILSQFFKPRDRLVERELCELTGVSRTSVREALRQLESEGLVEMVPQRGPIVASLDVADARDIYEVREALEGLAARLFVERASDTEIEALVAAAQRCVRAVVSREVPEMLDAIDEFSGTLFEGCRNALIASMLRTLRARLYYLRATTTHRQSDEHVGKSVENLERIIRAMRSRDPAAASSACVERVRHSAEVALEMLSGQEQGASG